MPKLPKTASNRQMNLLFDTIRSRDLAPAERDKAVSALAQILMQATGLVAEELSDDKR
jgi:hypothetical protein